MCPGKCAWFLRGSPHLFFLFISFYIHDSLNQGWSALARHEVTLNEARNVT